ncbi:MAG TPA: two-component regulator propeller domain-containing protein [Thermoanaerobaculia bacterium]|nr:two-component regulator propeller domain-containing protein [Thermoanaerobaculia bacterium]
MPPAIRSPWIVLCLALLWAPSVARALDPARTVSQYVRRAWTVEDGLPQDSVQTIAQTADGFLWFGTQEGLVRFDGARFTVYDSSTVPQLTAHNVTSLYRDRAGTLWIGTARGVVSYRQGRFQALPGTQDLRGVFAIRETGEPGVLWIGCAIGGLFRYANGRALRDEAGPESVYALAADAGTLWIGGGDGLYRHRAGRTERIEGGDGAVYSLYAVPGGGGGEVWMGGAGLRRYDGARVTRPVPDLDKEEVWAVTRDRHGSLWIGTRTGLWRWSRGELSRFREKDGLSHDFIDTIYEDVDGALWVGTHVGGVNQFHDGFVVTHTAHEGLSNSTVWSVSEAPDGVMWAATDQGLNRYANGRWTRVAASTGLHEGFITSVVADGDAVWAGTYGRGVVRLGRDGVTTFRKSDGLPDDVVYALLLDRAGTLWIGTASGLARLSGGAVTATYGKKDGLQGDLVIALRQDHRGRIWAASGSGGGLTVLEGGRFTTVSDGRQLPPERTFCIHEDRQRELWFGTRGGVYRLGPRGLFRYTREHGLPRGTVLHIQDDRDGALWMASGAGVFRIRRSDLDAVMTGRAKSFDPLLFGIEDGMPPGEPVNGTFPGSWQRRDGSIWIATTRGIAVVQPVAAPRALRFAPRIEETRVNAAVQTGAAVLRKPHDRLEVRYTVPVFVAPKRIRFRYRLEGYDDDWVEAGDRRVAEYTNLPPGRYRFHVEATDGLGSPRALLAPLSVRRLPVFYETGTFLVLCAAALAALIFFVHSRRMRSLRLRHEAVDAERRRIALELHDTLAQGLTGVALHIESAFASASDRERWSDHLRTAKRVIHSSQLDARRALLNLRSASLEGRDLGQALQGMMEMMTHGLPVEGSVIVTGTPRRLRTEEYEHHLLRIAQEAVTNALRHARASRIALTLEYAPGAATLTVRDDGGASDDSVAGLGVRGMRERAEGIGAALTTRVLPEGGLEVAVEVPT